MNIIKGLTEGQVLQRSGARGATTEISGTTAQAGLPLFVTISGATGALKGWKAKQVGKSGKQGLFSVTVRGIPAGGPYRLELSAGKEKATIRQFFVGDLWILAGQSNMEGVGNMTGAAKPHPLIRVFSMRHEWRQAKDPLHILAESPDKCHNGGTQRSREDVEQMRKSAHKGVGPGIFFAHEMLKRTGVPQALIATAHGGTSMAQWNPVDGEMYVSMLSSLKAVGQPVAGLLWYQGESDSNEKDAALYVDRMKALVAATRRALRQPRLPWVIVQIARVLSDDGNFSWNRIQELQRLLPDKIRNLETVSAIDLSLDDGIHISAEGYVVLGARLAMAMSLFVGREKMRPPQIVKSVERTTIYGPSIDVTFKNVAKGLKAPGEPHGFSLVNSDRKELPLIYKTTLHGNMVRLHCSTLMPGLYLHYGFASHPICNITDGRNMSLPVFGPHLVSRPIAMLGFVKTWKTTGLIATSEALKNIPCPDVQSTDVAPKTYPSNPFLEGFIEEHAAWEGKAGQQYFSSVLELEEPMKLRFLMGYDGPFRLWLDEKPFFQDLKGTNPALADQKQKSVALSAGRHSITVAMDINGGRAWGFFLRFIREDVPPALLKDNSYKKPVYST